MFPQLVAGPIIRFSEVADQLRTRSHTATKFARGIAFFSMGLVKKVLLANPCGKVADLAFEAGSLGEAVWDEQANAAKCRRSRTRRSAVRTISDRQ
jgi:D-alanyl-lipoteichoic acid acyltransferase DltB (MBOAT superfamily)